MGYLTMPKRALAYILTVSIILMAFHYVELWRHPRDVFSQSQTRPHQPGDPSAPVGLVVASKQADDTSWIYSPFSEWDKFVYVLDNNEAELSVPANKGQSAMAYLTHIVEHYDHLHDITIFHHASRYQWHNDDPHYDALHLLSQLNIPYVMSKGYHNLRCVWKLGCGHDAIHLDSALSHALTHLGDESDSSLGARLTEPDGALNKRQHEGEQNDEMNGGEASLDFVLDNDEGEQNDEMNGGDHDSDDTSDAETATTSTDGNIVNDPAVVSGPSLSSSSSRWTTSVSPSQSSSSSAPASSTTARDTAFDSPVDYSPTQTNKDGSTGTPSQSLSTLESPTVTPSPSPSSQAANSHPPTPTIPVGPSQSWDKNTTFRDAFQVLLPGAPIPHSISAPCCAQFAVTREVIRQRPKAHYERYRDWLVATDLEDEISSRVMEKLWHIIFGRPANDCPDAPACYCSLYGLCDLECENNRSCSSQWISPGNAAYSDNLEGSLR